MHVDHKSKYLDNASDKAPTILVLGVDGASIEPLNVWLGENIQLSSLNGSESSKRYMRFDHSQMAFELGGLSYPVKYNEAVEFFAFELNETTSIDSIAKIVFDDPRNEAPIFIHKKKENNRIFAVGSWNEVHKRGNILTLSPVLVYFKAVFGERLWHRPVDYANLTIDDPWLREPYGFVNFAGLCSQASDVPFHATIGFIPFNFKSSKNDVVNIFQECSNHLSIAVHGNNHDFVEFRTIDYSENAKSVAQALKRMESFEVHTDLSYDRVMIFPRNTFTKESLTFLKRQNFLMTVNSGIPFNADKIESPIDRIRGVTLEFENFPVAIRKGLLPGIIKQKEGLCRLEQLIRIRLFLDLPVMLHAHHDFFEDGIDHFNSIAMMVNRIQPKVVWASLGGVAANLYLQRRVDNKVEVLSFSPQMVLKNAYEEPTLFSVSKREDGSVPIGSVQVDGIAHAFTYDGNFVRMNIPMEPGTEKKVVIQYNDMGGNPAFAYEKRDVGAIFIRKLSDFRDNYVFRLPFGSLIMAEISKKKASMVFVGIGVFVLIFYLAVEKKILNLRVS